MSEIKGGIASSTYPLAFRAQSGGLNLDPLPRDNGMARIRTFARTLEGMQKEAVIQYGPTGTVWRVVCDEGPWLNGTDLAPFPLAFFTAGIAASLMSEFVREAGDRRVRVNELSLEQDNFFTMEGSALKGTMKAGAKATQVSMTSQASASAAEIKDIAETAVQQRCPAQSCLRNSLPSQFAIHSNGQELRWPGQAATDLAMIADSVQEIGCVRPASQDDLTIISKSGAAAESSAPAVGLQANQKRVVHVHTDGKIRDDGLFAISVQCITPAGSCFRILSENRTAHVGQERAPGGLVYLSAGIAFCFMTQIGRYAQITKQQLNGYRITQDTAFRFSPDQDPRAYAVETLVCLDTNEPEDKSIQLVRMAEQTCYVHAAFRAATATEIEVVPGTDLFD